MNTTAAALEAHVTAATIRTWCRIGAVAALKTAGRWVIDAASLAHRIAIGTRKAKAMTDQSMYRLEEGSEVQYGKTRATWTIVRTDGTPAGYGRGKDTRIHNATFFTRETAEFYMKFYENTPAGYSIRTYTPRSGSISRASQWQLTGGTEGDPKEIRLSLPTDWTPTDAWPADTTQVDVLIGWACDHAAGAAKRIQDKAEQDAIDAAEDAVREAREQQLDDLRRRKGALATEKQVDYILQLLDARSRSGEGGGFFSGPTTRARIEEMSKADASLYINSLKGAY